MIINDKNGLLKVNSMMDELLEELDQNAAGPELEKAAELDNEATLEKEPSELTSDIDNEDVYGDDEEFAEDVGEVVCESATLEELLEYFATSSNEEVEYIIENVLNEDEISLVESFLEENDIGSLNEGLREVGWKIADGFHGVKNKGQQAVAGIKAKLQKIGDRHDARQFIRSQKAEDRKANNSLKADANSKLKDLKKANKEYKKGFKAYEKENAVYAGMSKEQQKAKREELKRKYDLTDAGKKAGEKQVAASLQHYNSKQTYKNKMDQYEKDKKALYKKSDELKSAAMNSLKANQEKAASQRDENRKAVLVNKREKAAAKLNNRLGAGTVNSYGRVAMAESFSDLELLKLLEEDGYEATLENLLILREGLEDGSYEIFYEEELETEVMPAEAEDSGVADDEPAERGEEKKDSEEKKDESEEDEESDEKEDDEKEDEEKEETVNEGLDGIFALINQINESLSQEAAGPELEGAKELKNEATVESDGKELTSVIDNKDVYDAEDHEQKEDVGEVVVKESERLAAGPELEAGKELKNEATKEEAEKELTSDKDNKDVFPAEDHEQKEDVGEVVVKESEQLAAGPELEAGKELKNEATVKTDGKELTSAIDNKDVYDAEDHEQKEDVGEVVVKESEQLAAGPELDSAKELDNEATEEKDPKTAPASTDNKDVYCDHCHKQVEDVVEVVVEAVSACKAKGKPATKENIAEEAKELFEMANFDIDAFIMSREMNGSKKFDEYEKLEGKGAECALTGIRESVKYNSLKEACMMDEGYFAEDSYVKETAGEKVAKLTEQVSLLMAREANDPLYDELLKESAYCMRLREQLQNKYKRAASAKVNVITESKN